MVCKRSDKEDVVNDVKLDIDKKTINDTMDVSFVVLFVGLY